MKIVFLSHTSRSSIFKVGSYHLSNELARMGHDVLYISSALSPFHFANIPAIISDEHYRKNLLSRRRTFTAKKDKHNITNLTPFVCIPFHKGIFDNLRIPLNQWFTFNNMAKQIREADFEKADLVIQDKAGLFFMRKFINADTWIYRPTDDYSSMPGGPSAQTIQALERHICKYSNGVIVTSEPLKKIFNERYYADANVLRNGVDVRHFKESRDKPVEYQQLDKPIILYLGSLDDRFDLDLLLAVAHQSQDYHYVIVGPGSEKAIPNNISNISVLGPKPYSQVPAYMQHADVGILPLKLTEANHARSPMKMYEYGICGLPVVSTPLRELQSRDEKFVYFAQDADQFSEQITYCIHHKNELMEVAKRDSQKHSWYAITKQLLAFSNQIDTTSVKQKTTE